MPLAVSCLLFSLFILHTISSPSSHALCLFLWFSSFPSAISPSLIPFPTSTFLLGRTRLLSRAISRFFQWFSSFWENPDFQLVICRIISGFQATCFSRYELNKWFSPDFVSRIISGFKISRSYALAYRGFTLLQVSQSSQVSSSHSLPLLFLRFFALLLATSYSIHLLPATK